VRQVEAHKALTAETQAPRAAEAMVDGGGDAAAPPHDATAPGEPEESKPRKRRGAKKKSLTEPSPPAT